VRGKKKENRRGEKKKQREKSRARTGKRSQRAAHLLPAECKGINVHRIHCGAFEDIRLWKYTDFCFFCERFETIDDPVNRFLTFSMRTTADLSRARNGFCLCTQLRIDVFRIWSSGHFRLTKYTSQKDAACEVSLGWCDVCTMREFCGHVWSLNFVALPRNSSCAFCTAEKEALHAILLRSRWRVGAEVQPIYVLRVTVLLSHSVGN